MCQCLQAQVRRHEPSQPVHAAGGEAAGPRRGPGPAHLQLPLRGTRNIQLIRQQNNV